MGTMIERTAAIQAGGASRRMGRDKGLVRLAGIPLVERVLAQVDGLIDQIIITANDAESYRYLGLPIARDKRPGAGALEGLRTALANASGERVLVVGCDMPFLNPELMALLLDLADGFQAVLPRWDERLQPLCAVYQRSCLHAIERSLASGQKRMIAFHDQVDVRIVGEDEVATFDPDGLSFFNVNTPEDLAAAERILTSRGR
jgi:molybdopterin-guanine dinucleotide biosynthesis protein A